MIDANRVMEIIDAGESLERESKSDRRMMG